MFKNTDDWTDRWIDEQIDRRINEMIDGESYRQTNNQKDINGEVNHNKTIKL